MASFEEPLGLEATPLKSAPLGFAIVLEEAFEEAFLASASIFPAAIFPLVRLPPEPAKEPMDLKPPCILGITTGAPAFFVALEKEFFATFLSVSRYFGGGAKGAAEGGLLAPLIRERGSLTLKGVTTSPAPSGEPTEREFIPGS